MTIRENVAALETRMQAACDRTRRSRDGVTLVAVSKTRTAAEIEETIASGITDIGENRVQEAATKKPNVRAAATWHLIGHLQTNKVKRALEVFDTIHSVDSLRLGREIQTRCEQAGRRLPVLVEVNTSAEPSKFGVEPHELDTLVRELLTLDRLQLTGLMTIGPGWATEDPEASRPCFRLLRRLAEQVRDRFGIALPHLSMGMSSDFPQGIEEGATIIRVGSAIFGLRTDRP